MRTRDSIVGPVDLTCHPTTPGAAVRRVEAVARRTDAGALVLTFALDGALDQLRIPAPRPPRSAAGLWRHTCFEAFIAVEVPGYHEFNFAPSGEWAAYAFRGYRDGEPIENDALTPAIAVRRLADRLELEACVRLDALSPTHRARPLRLALAAVLEESDGTLSYWALRHPAGTPDFHHPEGFAVRLEPPAGAC